MPSHSSGFSRNVHAFCCLWCAAASRLHQWRRAYKHAYIRQSFGIVLSLTAFLHAHARMRVPNLRQRIPDFQTPKFLALVPEHIKHAIRNGTVAIAVIALLLNVAPAGMMHAEGEPAPAEETTATDQNTASDTTEGANGSDGTAANGGLVVTGDTSAAAEVENAVNVNQTDTTGTGEEPINSNGGNESILSGGGSDGNTDDAPAASEGDGAGVQSEPDETAATTTIANENIAAVATDVEAGAETGTNTAEGGDGNVTIDTGEARAAANVVNVVNANLTNSNGYLMLLNALFGLGGNFDLRASDFFGRGSPYALGGCVSGCDASAGALDIYGSSTASLLNHVLVRAATGENAATTSAAGLIGTGNAYAAANMLNIANTNIVDSNYILLAFNNFGAWNGDFVLPGKEFFSQFFQRPERSIAGNVLIENENEGNVQNNVATDALTGKNDATASSTLVETGNAFSSADTFNEVNTNLVGGESFVLLLRVHGNWSGDVFSAPDGVFWEETPFGVRLTSVGNEATTSIPMFGAASTTIRNSNRADVTNNVRVVALTGQNRLAGGEGATIRTGNAYAAANVFNLVNTNIVGRNWIWAVINIFGDWTGNLAFGRPDLLVLGTVVSDHSPIGPNSEVDYRFTILNRGDADATNVRLRNVFDGGQIAFESDGHGQWVDSGNVDWGIGTIPAGGIVEVTYGASVSSQIPAGTTQIMTTVTAVSRETDEDMRDNTEELSIAAFRDRERGDQGGTPVSFTPEPRLTITKTNSATSSVIAPASVNYKIVITNTGQGPAYHAKLVDELKNSAGQVIHTEEWNLETIPANEEIEITYTTGFNAATQPGVYTNHAQVRAVGGHSSLDPFYGYFTDSNVATSIVTVAGGNAEAGNGNTGTSDDDDNTGGGASPEIGGTSAPSNGGGGAYGNDLTDTQITQLHNAQAALSRLASTLRAAASAIEGQTAVFATAREAVRNAIRPSPVEIAGFPYPTSSFSSTGTHNSSTIPHFAAIGLGLPLDPWWLFLLFLVSLWVIYRIGHYQRRSGNPRLPS